LLYFVFFSLGFGWPLVLLPLLAAPIQRRFTSTLTRHHRAIGIASGVLLVVVAAIGLWVDVRPSLFPEPEAAIAG
jgi:cytochrome c biogenesis protein CcdA